MTVSLNAIEVFEIAQQIERNAAKFYRKAAELSNEPDISNIFIELAGWEIRHEQVFKDMGDKLVDSTRKTNTELEKKQFDTNLMACLAVFGTVSDPPHKLKSIRKITDALKTAIEKEKDSIAFYEGLKAFVKERDDQIRVDAIIEEEMHHVKILNQALKQRE
ncbi:MAG: ferritin family protein [Sedimentisphaerales bacterium]|nr:ferritin family protein [Sedimentisphaerales bacterium]